MVKLAAALMTALLLAVSAALPARAADDTLVLTLKDGDVVIKLRPDLAPNHVERIKALTEQGFYNGVVFHRVIENFMIQTGGYDAKLAQRPNQVLQPRPTKAPIPLESHNGLSNVRGSIAMARTADPNSATAQFFINVVDNPMLDGQPDNPATGYAVFGQVIEGMDVVDKIRTAPVSPYQVHQHLPEKAILINKAIIEK